VSDKFFVTSEEAGKYGDAII